MKWSVRTSLVLTALFSILAASAIAQTPDTKAGGGYTYGYYNTYGAGVADVALAASATDVFCVQGSATRIIYVKKIVVNGTATSANKANLLIIKRSTANTGGTASTLTDVPYDSQDPAGTATVKAYTANPTTGTAVGTVASSHSEFAPDGSPTLPSDVSVFDFGGDGNKRITLRGTAESLCVNFNAETITGGIAHFTTEWIEQ